MDRDSIPLSFATDQFNHAINRRFPVIGQVHGDLSPAFYKQTQSLAVPHPACGVADGLGDFLGDVHIVGGQIGIKCDQRIACTDNSRSCRAEFGRSKIGTCVPGWSQSQSSILHIARAGCFRGSSVPVLMLPPHTSRPGYSIPCPHVHPAGEPWRHIPPS